MTWKAVRKFNGAVDPHWSTPEGIEEWGGYATFDHTLGGGYFGDALDAARKFIKGSKGVAETLGKMSEYDNAMRELSDTNPRNFSFVFNQDLFEISGAFKFLNSGDQPRTNLENLRERAKEFFIK